MKMTVHDSVVLMTLANTGHNLSFNARALIATIRSHVRFITASFITRMETNQKIQFNCKYQIKSEYQFKEERSLVLRMMRSFFAGIHEY